MVRILCSQYTLIDPHSHSLGHESPWTWHTKPRVQNYFYFTFYQHMEQVLLSLQVLKMQRDIKSCILWAVNSAHFWRGGWQLYASFSQSFLLQFWKSQCPSGSKYPEFSNTPPTFAFWMSLRVVMAIFPRNDIFFGTPCTYYDKFPIEGPVSIFTFLETRCIFLSSAFLNLLFPENIFKLI